MSHEHDYRFPQYDLPPPMRYLTNAFPTPDPGYRGMQTLSNNESYGRAIPPQWRTYFRSQNWLLVLSHNQKSWYISFPGLYRKYWLRGRAILCRPVHTRVPRDRPAYP